MEKRDYLKRQIDQLAMVLEKLFTDLLGLKNSGQLNTGLDITNQVLRTELDIDIYELLDMPAENFIDILTTQKNFTNESLDTLAEILLLIADSRQDDNKKIYEKCLAIYVHLEKTEKTYNLDRQLKINRIKFW